MKKKILTAALLACMSVCSCAFASVKVGISLPSDDVTRRWFTVDAPTLKNYLENMGHQVHVEYSGDNEGHLQNNQIVSMIEDGVDVLIITPVDSHTIMESLKMAGEKNIPVIAYDRIIQDTSFVNYYVSFDSYDVGRKQAEYIVDHLDFSDGKPKKLEFFSGPAFDANSKSLYNGAMDVLKPYLEDGRIVIPSGDVSFEDTITEQWSSRFARKRMEKMIVDYHYDMSEHKIDAVLAPNDSTAKGIVEALYASGFRPGSFPIVTGQDCDKTAIGFIMQKAQSMSVFKDARELGAIAARLADSIDKKELGLMIPQDTVFNGEIDVPSIIVPVIAVDRGNIGTVLIGSGFYDDSVLDDYMTLIPD